MNKELLEAIKQFKSNENTKKQYNNPDDNVLIIDGTNYFIRNWSVNPSKDINGEFIGGAVGFIRSLGYLCGLVRPTRIIIAFDGRGGSKRRKEKYGGYKEGRGFKTKTSDYHDLTDPEEIRANMIYQFDSLVKFLQYLPIKIIMLDHIEADDVISYITTHGIDGKVTIASSDNDYLQLINERVCVFSPQLKKVVCEENFKGIYGFNSRNFIWYKCILGDKSDDVPNLKKIGKTTFNHLIEFLNEDVYTNPDEFIEKLNEYIIKKENEDFNIKVLKHIKKIKEQIEIENKQFRINFEIMQLADVDISGNNKMTILQMIREPIIEVNLYEFRKSMSQFPIFDINNSIDVWYRKNFSTIIKS